MITDLFNAKQKFNSLDNGVKLACILSNWVNYNLRENADTETYQDFFQLRLFVTEVMQANNLTNDVLPEINQDNFISIWFMLKRDLNIKSFREMKDNFYSIKKVGGYYFAQPI